MVQITDRYTTNRLKKDELMSKVKAWSTDKIEKELIFYHFLHILFSTLNDMIRFIFLFKYIYLGA